MTKLEQAKQVDCNEILRESGYEPKRSSGGKNFYTSPWRKDADPSLCVFSSNGWKDFGSGENGDSIDLYERIYGVDTSEAIKSMVDGEYEVFEQKEVSKEPGVVIETTKDLTSPTLLAYFKSRKINTDIAKMYCKELHVRFPSSDYPGRIHHVIGFPNDRGGWEIRNEYLKVGSSPKYYSTIKGGYSECVVFEGFFDLLTLLTWRKTEVLNKDIFVYNSTSFFDISIPVLKGYSLNYLFLDNDAAGVGVAKGLNDNFIWCNGLSGKYSGYNDLNEWWCAKL
jgi:hypothetical protein